MAERLLGCDGCNRLEAEVKRLTKERDEAWEHAKDTRHEYAAYRIATKARLTAARAEGERYRKALLNFGGHAKGCSRPRFPECDCGWDMLRAALATGESDNRTESHLGPECLPDRHIWQTTEHGHDICLECKTTRPSATLEGKP